MEQKDIEYFRTLLNNMLEEAQHKGDSTLEDLTDSNELFADFHRPGCPPNGSRHTAHP